MELIYTSCLIDAYKVNQGLCNPVLDFLYR